MCIRDRAYPIGLYLLDSNGKSLMECDSKAILSAETTETFLLELNTIRTTLDPGKAYTLVPCTYKAQQNSGFNLVVNSNERVNIETIPELEFGYSKKITSEWNARNSIGSSKNPRKNYSQFINNPHIRVECVNNTRLRVHLQSQEDYLVAIHAYKITTDHQYELFADSGSYTNIRMGCFVNLDLQPNPNGYLFVFSTFEAGQIGKFTVEVCASAQRDVIITQNYDVNSFSRQPKA
eukprot:TRINITY_DN6765_c0_g1_i1.p1 TRINITY_DN6765_c0_g1~~TRINITY_DN6765_c0_g1_i1.p1  ORF type:complete len:255 (+),score=51.40 TRINITY_DN6765_c0_g1_i1:61-765(+)